MEIVTNCAGPGDVIFTETETTPSTEGVIL
jgi:hypothetical protein